MTPEQIGLWAGLVLTLMVFSYLLGDNFLYRLAVYIVVGLTAGFITVLTVESVIMPWLNTTVLDGNANIGVRVIGVLPVILVALLLLKASRFGRLGNLAMAVIISVGTAVALVGALTGSLIPLTQATTGAVSQDVLNGFLIVIGVISSLTYFRYFARRAPGGTIEQSPLIRFIGSIGRGFIIVTFGALYAGAILTGLTIFSERVAFLVSRFGGG